MYCLHHRSLRKSLPRFHAQCIMLSTNFEQNLSLLSFSFDTFDRPLKYRSFACYFDKVSKRTLCEECNNLVCTRDKTQARQFGSSSRGVVARGWRENDTACSEQFGIVKGMVTDYITFHWWGRMGRGNW